MSKKLYICAGKTCKKIKSNKLIKEWGEELIEEKKLNKLKKTKCLGICKEGFAIEYKGSIKSCESKEELEKIITKGRKKKKK